MVKKEKTEKEKWNQEFQAFMQSSGVTPPRSLSDSVFQMIENRLHPSQAMIFLKILGIHSVVSFLSLYFCGQFGVSLKDGSLGLMSVMMAYGETACMLVCGFVFISGSLGAALILMDIDTLRALKKVAPFHVTGLALLSLVAFLFVPSTYVTFSLALPWLIGAIVGGYGVCVGGIKLREHVSSLI